MAALRGAATSTTEVAASELSSPAAVADPAEEGEDEEHDDQDPEPAHDHTSSFVSWKNPARKVGIS